MKNLNEMTSKELKQLGKELKVKNWWSISKAKLIEGIKNAKKENKKQWKECCDQCGKADVLQEYDNKLLCDECIEKAEQAKEEIEETEETEEVEETKILKKTTSKKAKIKTDYLSNKELSKDNMYAIVTPNEYDVHEFIKITNEYLENQELPAGEIINGDEKQETYKIAFSKVKGQSKQQWKTICKAFVQAKKSILK